MHNCTQVYRARNCAQEKSTCVGNPSQIDVPSQKVLIKIPQYRGFWVPLHLLVNLDKGGGSGSFSGVSRDLLAEIPFFPLVLNIFPMCMRNNRINYSIITHYLHRIIQLGSCLFIHVSEIFHEGSSCSVSLVKSLLMYNLLQECFMTLINYSSSIWLLNNKELARERGLTQTMV